MHPNPSGLDTLTIGSLELTPEFSSETLEYTASTENESDVIEATATDPDDTVLITVNGDPVQAGSDAVWEYGENTVEVVVEDHETGSEKTYTVVVTRPAPETGLDSLTIGNLELTPEFASDVFEYTVETANASNKVTAVLKNDADNLVIKVNDAVIENETSPSWETGENTVEVTVTSEATSEVTTYTVVVTKTGE